MKKHWCHNCKGKGLVRTEQLRTVHGVKKTYAFMVDCPGKLAEQLDTSKLPIAGQDRAAGEKEDVNE